MKLLNECGAIFKSGELIGGRHRNSMTSEYPKNFILLAIIAALQDGTNGEPGISAKEIGQKIEKDYGIKADRKTISDNLRHLYDYGGSFGIEVDCSEAGYRTGRDGEKEVIRSGWYINRLFDESELRLLIDGILFSRLIGPSQRIALVKKLTKLAGSDFDAHAGNVYGYNENTLPYSELFHTIAVLDQAIADGRQVTFTYAQFDANKQLQMKLDGQGKPKQYTVTPFRMVMSNGRYYLICNSANHDNLSHFRMDRIRGIQANETAGKPLSEIKGAANGIDLPRHMAEHIYMCYGDSTRVRFAIAESRVHDLVDWFGLDYEVVSQGNGTAVVEVNVNEKAMLFWSLQYGQGVEVLSPTSLREKMRDVVREMARKYDV